MFRRRPHESVHRESPALRVGSRQALNDERSSMGDTACKESSRANTTLRTPARVNTLLDMATLSR